MDSRGGLQQIFTGRGRSCWRSVYARHIGMHFFTTVQVGKGVVCQDRAYLGLDGESAGGNGYEETLRFPGIVCLDVVKCG